MIRPTNGRSIDYFSAGSTVSLRAVNGPARLLLLGGEPIGKRHIWWNFVSSRIERIEQGKADWREGRFSPVPGETEYIPLPSDAQEVPVRYP